MATFEVENAQCKLDGVDLASEQTTSVAFAWSSSLTDDVTYFGIYPNSESPSVQKVTLEATIEYFLSDAQAAMLPSNTSKVLVVSVPGKFYCAATGKITANNPTISVDGKCKGSLTMRLDTDSVTWTISPSGSYS